MKKKVLIIGGGGYIGSNLENFLQADYNVFITHQSNDSGNKLKLNVTKAEEVYNLLKKISPDIVINAAAISSLKLCEEKPDEARAVNTGGVINIVDGLNKIKSRAKLIFFSSDYVFEGNRGNYKENDKRAPNTVYGKTKVEAEDYINRDYKNHIILRTANVHGRGGNFFNFVLESLKSKNTIDVFSDVYFTPTNIDFLMQSLRDLIDQNFIGTIHIAGSDRVSRYNFALKIAEAFNLDKSFIKKSKKPKDSDIASDNSLSTAKLSKLITFKRFALDKSLMMISGKLIAPYFSFVDKRGSITGITQSIKWEEINFLESKAGIVRGNHFHKKTVEAFYIIKGEIEVSLVDVRNGDTTSQVITAGDIIIIQPNIEHTFKTITKCSWVNMLSKAMIGPIKDFHKN